MQGPDAKKLDVPTVVPMICVILIILLFIIELWVPHGAH